MSEAQTKHAGGRPSTYDPQIAARLCEQLAQGRALTTVAPELGVGVRTVYQWMDAEPEFAQNYARAREDSADKLAGEIVDIADNTDEDSNSRRVRVDARKWVASKLKPKQYGERQQIDLDAKVEVAQAAPASIANQLVTLGTQYPTLNPVIRNLAQSILDRLPALPG